MPVRPIMDRTLITGEGILTGGGILTGELRFHHLTGDSFTPPSLDGT
jgi:hypothetical protein